MRLLLLPPCAVLGWLYAREWIRVDVRTDLLFVAASIVWRLAAEVGRVSTGGARWLDRVATNLEDRAEPGASLP